MSYRILVVDDEDGIRFGIRDYLDSEGFEVELATDCRGAEQAFRGSSLDAAILDQVLPDGTALDLLPKLKHIDSQVPVIILTGYGSIDMAVRAIKEGAENFLTKPTELSTLLVMLRRALESRRIRQKELASKTRQDYGRPDPFAGPSMAIKRLAYEARKVSHSESPVFIEGESGTGKGVLAAWLHNNSPRAEEAFVDLNCAGFSREFLETELFGHEKGAFTGAASSKPGLLEVAHQGTVFLDEIGDMDTAVQAKLLKVLEEKRFRRLGDVHERQVNVRLIAATHQDLRRLVQESKFRSDLYYRINTIPLVIPPLRDRAEDIPILAESFLVAFAADLSRRELQLAEDAVRALQAYSWPGNIRELRNVLERAVLLSDSNVIRRQELHLDAATTPSNGDADVNLSLVEVERRHIEKVLAAANGHVEKAATLLQIPRSTLYEKIKKLRITPSKF